MRVTRRVLEYLSALGPGFTGVWGRRGGGRFKAWFTVLEVGSQTALALRFRRRIDVNTDLRLLLPCFAHVLEVDLQGLHHVAAAAALPAAMTPGYRVASRNTPICKALASWHVWPCLGNRRRSCVESITLPRRVLDLLLVLPLKAHNRVCS